MYFWRGFLNLDSNHFRELLRMIIGLNYCLFGMLGWALFRGIRRASKERGNRWVIVWLFHQFVSSLGFEILNQLSLNPSNVTPLFLDIQLYISVTSSSVTGGKLGKLEIGGEDPDFPESFSSSSTQLIKISFADVTIVSLFSSSSWQETIDPSRFRGLRIDRRLIHLNAAEEDEVLMYLSIVEVIVSIVIFYGNLFWRVKRTFLNGFWLCLSFLRFSTKRTERRASLDGVVLLSS